MRWGRCCAGWRKTIWAAVGVLRAGIEFYGVVRDENRFYQVERQSQHHAPAKSKVTVCEWEDWEDGDSPPRAEAEVERDPRRARWPVGKMVRLVGEEASRATTKRKWRPGPDHPWRGGYREGNLGSLPLARPAAPSLVLGLRFALSAPPFGSAGLHSGRGQRPDWTTAKTQPGRTRGDKARESQNT